MAAAGVSHGFRYDHWFTVRPTLQLQDALDENPHFPADLTPALTRKFRGVFLVFVFEGVVEVVVVESFFGVVEPSGGSKVSG